MRRWNMSNNNYNSAGCRESMTCFQLHVQRNEQRRSTQTRAINRRLKPRVATRSPSTSSGVMCPLCVRRSSSVTGLLSTWLLRDLSLLRTPPPGLRSRGGAAAVCPPAETFSATGASLRALAPLIVDDLRSPSVSAGVSGPLFG